MTEVIRRQVQFEEEIDALMQEITGRQAKVTSKEEDHQAKCRASLPEGYFLKGQ